MEAKPIAVCDVHGGDAHATDAAMYMVTVVTEMRLLTVASMHKCITEMVTDVTEMRLLTVASMHKCITEM
jgi:hypothetical protein